MRLNSRSLTILAAISLAGCMGGDSGSAPTPRFTYSCVEFLCTFDASATTDPDGGDLGYLWDFGDESLGAGEIVSHAYVTSGEMAIKLTVTDDEGNSKSVTDTLVAAGDPAAAHFGTVHDALSILILLEETVASIITSADAIQDQVEAQGNPADVGYSFNCSHSGTAEIVSWNDTNNSLSIDGDEVLTFRAENCSFTNDADALTTAASVEIAGDFDGTNFVIGGSPNPISRFGVARVGRWAIQGEISVTATRNGSEIESVAYESIDLKTYHLTENGGVDLTLRTPLDLVSDFDNLSGIAGEWTVRFTGESVNYYSVIDPGTPVTIGTSGSDLQLQSGEINAYVSSDRIDISPDADPAYLDIEN